MIDAEPVVHRMTTTRVRSEMTVSTPAFRTTSRLHRLAALLLLVAAAGCSSATGGSRTAAPVPDPRITLKGGWQNAEEAAWNVELVGHHAKPAGFFDADSIGIFAFANSDLAFKGNYVFQGGWHGLQVWDISNPRNPTTRVTYVCQGGQGDVSVYRNLLFSSVEEIAGRLDCGAQGVTDTVSADRFRGVRIFDISDIDHPRPIATVQTCRGSHTHTLVTDPHDSANVYIYVSGTGSVRSGSELSGCSDKTPQEDPNTSLFRIDVIRVPLAAPQTARVVSNPRVFASASGNVAGLWKGGNHGEGTQETSETSRCHDITVYSAIGLAAGACSGNGILLDIRDIANPRRIAEVSDPNFAYWHSATFNNDGTKVLFTDEWGGGTRAKCLATDRREWGADAIYSLRDANLTLEGFYKLPVPQDSSQNCVAHNGSMIPVPGRDIMAQAWYQGGMSVLDFTDPAHAFEIAYFDRGPQTPEISLGGQWGTYWYNGRIYGSEIQRGLDIFELTPSAFLSRNEIEAAKLVHFDELNPQTQRKFVWPASFVVARAYLDQLVRNNGLSEDRTEAIEKSLARAEKLSGETQTAALTALASQIDSDASSAKDAAKVRALAAAVRALSSR